MLKISTKASRQAIVSIAMALIGATALTLVLANSVSLFALKPNYSPDGTSVGKEAHEATKDILNLSSSEILRRLGAPRSKFRILTDEPKYGGADEAWNYAFGNQTSVMIYLTNGKCTKAVTVERVGY